MSPKTERFEMRFDEETLARIDRWRGEQDDLPSRAGAIRRLVESGLATSARGSVSLSDGEKLTLVMLGDIYRHLKMKDAEIDPEFVAEAISDGHYWALKWALPGLFSQETDDPVDLEFVVGVLEMWEFLERGYERLPKKERDRVAKEAGLIGRNVRFVGFDGNAPGGHLGIANFLVERLGRFQRFKGRDLNAHMPTAESFRRMLAVFTPLRVGLVGRELQGDEMISVLKASSHPVNSRSSPKS